MAWVLLYTLQMQSEHGDFIIQTPKAESVADCPTFFPSRSPDDDDE